MSSPKQYHRRLTFLLSLTLIAALTYIASITDALPRREHLDAVRYHVGQFVETHIGALPYTSFGVSTDTKLRLQDGVAYVQQLGRRHPMEELFEMGQRRAEEVKDTIDRVREGGVESAVEDYRQAFGMEPPECFDSWYVTALTALP